MFRKVGDFLQSVYTCLSKRILHEKNFRKVLWCVIPWPSLFDETALVCCLQSIWCQCTACWTYLWTCLVHKGWSPTGSHLKLWKKAALCTTCLLLNKMQLKVWGRSCNFCCLISLNWTEILSKSNVLSCFSYLAGMAKFCCDGDGISKAWLMLPRGTTPCVER